MADQVTKKDLQALRAEFTKDLQAEAKSLTSLVERRFDELDKRVAEHSRQLHELSTAIDQLRGLVSKHAGVLDDLTQVTRRR